MRNRIVRIIGGCIFFIQAGHGLASGNSKPSVISMKIRKEPIADTLFYPAQIVALRTVTVYAETEGFVQSLNVQLGQPVKSGELLMEIQNPDSTFKYQKYKQKAPIEGIVSQIEINSGDRVQRVQPLLNITDNSKIKIMVHIPTKDLGHLKVGTIGRITLTRNEFSARIKALSPIANSVTGTAPCEMEPTRKAPLPTSLVPGTIGRAQFKVNERHSILVPDSAIFYSNKNPFVITLASISGTFRAKYVPIKILGQSNEKYEIHAELTDGTMIVSSSSSFIKDDDEVTIENSGL